MKERPILMSAPMVRAILDGRKTVTRRIVKPQPEKWIDCYKRSASPLHWLPEGVFLSDPSGFFGKGKLSIRMNGSPVKCPYGVPGDRLWVRECLWHDTAMSSIQPTSIRYAADCDDPRKGQFFPAEDWHKVSSIHMPHWASRLTLEVVSVRVERVQEITGEDAIAEGFDTTACERVLLEAAGKVVPEGVCHWVEHADGTETQGDMCHACADKYVRKHKGSFLRSSACPESDGPAYCNADEKGYGCGVPLTMSLTRYGVERELFLDSNGPEDTTHFAATGTDAAIAAMIAGGIGDLRDEHKPRLAQIGFATLWDKINGDGSWAANPWVWVVEFKRLPQSAEAAA